MEQSALFFQLLKNKYFTGKDGEIQKILPQGEQKALFEERIETADPHIILPKHAYPLEKIHYSWIEDTLKGIPKHLQRVLIGAFPEMIGQTLGKKMNAELPLFSPSIQNFLLGIFYTHFPEKKILARSLLKENRLSPLLSLTKVELVHLIDLLPIHDLAEEVRHIVDKKVLQAIVTTLSQPQQKYLRICLHRRTKVPPEPLYPQRSYQDPKKFAHLLHKRGLFRFSLALSKEMPDFIWHICHTLDIGRGKIIQKNIEAVEKRDENIQMIQTEILQIIQYLKGKELS
jgi:hypothetical protein